jgi:hypothetical protein
MGERKCCGKTGGACADNGNVDVHRFRQDLLASRLGASVALGSSRFVTYSRTQPAHD